MHSSSIFLITTALASASFTPWLLSSEKDLPEMENLDFSNQNLKTFDGSLYPSVQKLNVSNNQLESLDLSSNPMLRELDCSNNQLKTLNLSQENALLTSLDCSNNCLATLELDFLPILPIMGTCKVENQKIVLPKNLTTLNLRTQFKADLSRLHVTESSQGVIFNSTTGELTGLQPHAQVTYTYIPFKSRPDLLMDVTLSFTGMEDSTLFDQEEPTSNLDSLPAFSGGTSADSHASDQENGISMHRLYNPNTGEHLYTSDINERDTLSKIGWNSEGIGWIAPQSSSLPVYRLYNPITEGGDHHYTMDVKERDALRVLGWRYENIGWYSANKKDPNGVPLYRQYNPNQYAANHNYTADLNEHTTLVGLGWHDEGIAWYGLKSNS